MAEPEMEPLNDSPRTHLAWLMWCYEQGYVNADDREGMTNWLLEDPTTLHPDDAALRPHLLAMADKVLDILDRTDGHDPTYLTGHAGTTTEHEVAGPTSPGQSTGAAEQADVQGEPSTDPLSPESTQSLLTKSVRVLSTSDLLALMHAIVTEFQRRWEEAEDG